MREKSQSKDKKREPLDKIRMYMIAGAIGTLVTIGAVAMTNWATEAPSLEGSTADQIMDEAPIFPDISGDPTSKHMLMAFPLAIDPGETQKVGISDYTWMTDVILVGEAVLT
ncbi:MAG: hypothetical protein ACREBU_02480, partial [Nitrososphaera sp.]